MEPAVYRREHPTSDARGIPQDMSQWSPPFIGGSTIVAARMTGEEIESQWSPPFIGGSTLMHNCPSCGLAHVAMEPAVYRREHRAELVGGIQLRVVAMEPAVYRREHARDPEQKAQERKSQWSPPFIGGSTPP